MRLTQGWRLERLNTFVYCSVQAGQREMEIHCAVSPCRRHEWRLSQAGGPETKGRALTVALSFTAAAVSRLQFSWHVTKCNIHTAASSLHSGAEAPSFTPKLLSLPRSQPQARLVLAFVRPLPASISSRLHSTAIAFLLCLFSFFSFYNNTVCLRGAEPSDAAGQPPGLERPLYPARRAPCVCSDV